MAWTDAWARVAWTVALLAVIGGVLGALIGGACEDVCTAEDQDRCESAWAACAADGGALDGCRAIYCDCLEARGCAGTCAWERACADEDGDTDTDGGI